MRRVVVTGMGAITPIGNDVETFWNGLKEKKLGFGPITYLTRPIIKQSSRQSQGLRAEGLYGSEGGKKNGAFRTVCGSGSPSGAGGFFPRHDKGRSVPCRCLRELRYRKLTDHREEYKKLLEKGPNRVTASGAAHDQQHGSRKRVHPVWLKGKEHQRRDSMRVRYELHR